MATINEPITLSGGPVDGPLEGTGWAANACKAVVVDGDTVAYRRSPPDRHGNDPMQAVYIGIVGVDVIEQNGAFVPLT